MLPLQVMYLDLIQNNGGSPMSGLSMFHFSLLFDSDSSAAHAANRAWDTLLEGSSNPSMHDTAEFFRENGITMIKY